MLNDLIDTGKWDDRHYSFFARYPVPSGAAGSCPKCGTVSVFEVLKSEPGAYRRAVHCPFCYHVFSLAFEVTGV